MERTMISWNLANWITVILMALAFYVALGLVSQLFMRSNSRAIAAA